MKTVKILPPINNVDFCGRVVREPYISASGKTMFFDLIRNFGGDKKPVVMTFVMFKPKNGFPDFLKKGKAVIAHAYYSPVTYTNKEGNEVDEVNRVIKSVEEAVLVEKTVSGDEPSDSADTEEPENNVDINEN